MSPSTILPAAHDGKGSYLSTPTQITHTVRALGMPVRGFALLSMDSGKSLPFGWACNGGNVWLRALSAPGNQGFLFLLPKSTREFENICLQLCVYPKYFYFSTWDNNTTFLSKSTLRKKNRGRSTFGLLSKKTLTITRKTVLSVN